MKPVTSALHNWVSALIVNKEFKEGNNSLFPDI